MNGTEIITLLSSDLPSVMPIVQAVTGSIFTAIFLRHNTKITEFEKVKAGQFKELADDLLDSGKMTYTEYYKANNFLNIAKKADEHYSKIKHESAERNYDFDWFIRFYEATGNVSDEFMQELWSKILAGEIAQPSSFSFKTIDVMKNFGKEDAELFLKLCEHSFIFGQNRIFLPNNDDYMNNCKITYSDVLKLNEYGLIFNDSMIASSIPINKVPQLVFTNETLIMLISSASGKEEKTNILQYPFTSVGNEIASIIDSTLSDEDFIRYGRILSKEKQYKIAIHQVIRWDSDVVEHDDTNLIEDLEENGT